VESTRPFPYQVDGDYLGETRRLRFQHRPEVMDLVFPLGS
jgi:diacylglycerol kinase family enzyme